MHGVGVFLVIGATKWNVIFIIKKTYLFSLYHQTNSHAKNNMKIKK